jgi:hypothetical protein
MSTRRWIELSERYSIGEFFADCALTYAARRGVYRDAWKEMSLEDLVAGLRLKAARVDAMIRVNGDVSKIIDDLRDLAVYAYFVFAKLNNNGTRE